MCPLGSPNFRAFHSAGLWLAVTAMPPDASEFSTASMSVGVDTTPRSTTSEPTETRPVIAARESIGPEGRVSLPIRMSTGRPSPASAERLRKAPKAAANEDTSSGR